MLASGARTLTGCFFGKLELCECVRAVFEFILYESFFAISTRPLLILGSNPIMIQTFVDLSLIM